MGDLSEHFDRSEFECSCSCGQDTVDAELIKVLEDVRTYFNRPVNINSGNRCESYNKSIGGSPNSQHLRGRAADITVEETPVDVVHEYLFQKYLDKYGIGCYTLFCHIDTKSGGKRRWGG